MTINFDCRNCGRAYRVKEEFAGRKIKCKECHSVVRVPTGAGDIDEYLEEEAEDEFSSAIDQAVGDSLTSSSLPPKRSSASRSKRRKSSRSNAVGGLLNANGGPALAVTLKVIGLVISAFGYLSLGGIARYNGASLFVILLFSLGSLAFIRKGFEGEDRWVTGPASFVLGHSIITLLAMFMVGDVMMVIDVAILGVCALLMLNIPGVITTLIPIAYYGFSFAMLTSSSALHSLDIQLSTVQSGIAMNLSASMIVILLGGLFLCLASKVNLSSS